MSSREACRPFRWVVLGVLAIISGRAAPAQETRGWQERADAVPDAEIPEFVAGFCLESGRHIGLEAIGRCSRCSGYTPCCNMLLCDACAGELGVCPFDGLRVGWTGIPEEARDDWIVHWLAVLTRGPAEARPCALRFLGTSGRPEILPLLLPHSDAPALRPLVFAACGAMGGDSEVDLLVQVLGAAPDEYWAVAAEEDRESWRAAGDALVAIGTPRALDAVRGALDHGPLWARVSVLNALAGRPADAETLESVIAILDDGIRRDREWLWIPGRDLLWPAIQAVRAAGLAGDDPVRARARAALSAFLDACPGEAPYLADPARTALADLEAGGAR